MKKLLVACEFSGTVRDAFKARGWDAWSCDILPTEKPGQHIQGDVLEILDQGWDMMIAHPPCTYLSNAGQRWFKSDPTRIDKARIAFKFFMCMVEAPIPLIAIENPRGLTWKWYKHPDQIIHPYQFGHNVSKATCLWLKGLPPLMATLIHSDPIMNWTRDKKGAHNGKSRSVTFQGIADAMASQWG